MFGINKNGTKHKIGIIMPANYPSARVTFDPTVKNVLPASANTVQKAVDEVSTKIAVVSGNIGASTNTWYFFPFPDGFNGTNCVVIGYSAETNDGHVWYSNNTEVTVMADSQNGVRIRTSVAAYLNSPFKIFLARV